MPRVSLPRKAKVEPLFPQPVVIGEVAYRSAKRIAKKPKLSVDPRTDDNNRGDDNDPRPVYVDDNGLQDLDFAPVPITSKGTASGITRSSKKRAISAIQSLSAPGAPEAVSSVLDLAGTVRPQPYGQPLVWAEERQNLCEALPYYRAFQSAAYMFGNLTYAVLLDKDSIGAHPYMDEEIVITRAGGACKVDGSGNMQQIQSQSGDALSITSFRNCMEQKHAVALIVGSANQYCPTAIPHTYCVMDWFQVTDVWAENFNGKVCYKFRFEKIELHKKSWWAPQGSSLPSTTRTFDTKATFATCAGCGSISKKIYRDAWMCLNEKCDNFFSVNGQIPANPCYSIEFLNERSQWPKEFKLGSLKPEPTLAELGDANSTSLNYSRAAWKGMVCPQCGRCISRVHWSRWECQTQSCGFSRHIQLTPLSHMAVVSSHALQGTGHAVPQDRHMSPIILREPVFLGNWRIHTYEVMADTQPETVVTHFHANSLLNNVSGGANDMFRALQEAEIGLQRFPLKSSPVKGEILTKHFTTNYGMPYKYIVAVDSKPFEGAPKVIMDGLNRLTWAGKHTVSDKEFLQFNELLALGYFEEQSIGYHDDGEEDLGPTIATMSLGGEADMTIRMKEKYYNAKKIRFNPYNPDAPVIKGCQLYEERLELNALHKSGCSDEVLRAQEEVLRTKAQKCGRISAPPILSMRLHHGDMVVMHGGDMQKYFEHSVTPVGKLRFALTARYVNPAKIDPSDRWKGDFVINPMTAYNGDVDFPDEGPSEFSTWNGDSHMKNPAMATDISSSSQVTLVADDYTPNPTMKSDHLDELYQAKVQDL